MDRIRRQTILERRACDLRALTLSAVEAFVLSLIDGRLTVAELADVHGMTMAELFVMLDHLLAVGAVAVVSNGPTASPAAKSVAAGPSKPPAGRTRPPPAAGGPTRRDSKSLKRRRTSTSLARVSRETSAPPKPRGKTGDTIAPPRQRRESVRMRRPTIAPQPPREPAADQGVTAPAAPAASRPSAPAISDAARVRILAVDASLSHADHYSLLGVARGADKAAIKRAYFALAGEFHPDRHFGKDLGPLRPVLQRIFVRLTEAHDTLASRARRAVYDATLPPLADPPTSPTPAATDSPPPAPADEKRAPDNDPPSVAVASPAPPASAVPPVGPREAGRDPGPPPAPARVTELPRVEPTRAPPVKTADTTLPPGRVPTNKPTVHLSSHAPVRVSQTPTSTDRSGRDPSSRPPVTAPTDAPLSGTRPRRDDALLRLYQATKREEVQRRVAVFVEIAEDALRRNDVVTAAHHFRLALQNDDDPLVRAKLRAIEKEAAEQLERRAAIKRRTSEGIK